MSDLESVLTAVSAAGRPISAIDVCDITDMDKEPVGKALGTLYSQGKLAREEVPNVLAGKTGQRQTMFVYTPTGDNSSQVAAPKAKPAIKAAALTPRPRWLVTPMEQTHDSRETALDEATRLATSEGMAFAVVRVEAVATVKVEIAWEA